MSFKITEIGVWIATEKDGTEGIPAMEIEGMMIPLIGADAARIKDMKPYAEMISQKTGCPMEFKLFKLVEAEPPRKFTQHGGERHYSDEE